MMVMTRGTAGPMGVATLVTVDRHQCGARAAIRKNVQSSYLRCRHAGGNKAASRTSAPKSQASREAERTDTVW